jgi:hypothetical protein
MDTTSRDAAEPPSWFEASEQVLDPLVNARMLLALVEGAERAGLLRAMRTTTTVPELARATGLSEPRVRDICAAGRERRRRATDRACGSLPPGRL